MQIVLDESEVKKALQTHIREHVLHHALGDIVVLKVFVSRRRSGNVHIITLSSFADSVPESNNLEDQHD